MIEAIALVERYYRAFNAGDVDGMVACLAPDVAHHVNQGGVRVGHGAFREFCTHMNERYSEQLTNLVIMATQDGSRAAAEFTVNGTYVATDEGLPEASGQTYVVPAGGFFGIKNGRITRVVTYYNMARWMAQISS